MVASEWQLSSSDKRHGLLLAPAPAILLRTQSSVLINFSCLTLWPSLVVPSVKNLPATQETQVRFLGEEDPLEEEMAPHSSVLAWRAPWTEEPGGLESRGSQESDVT